MSFNIEGFKRNKFYLAKIVEKHKPFIMCLQEHWTSYHEVNSFETDFSAYKFHSSASDMFIPTEEILMKSGTAWHGTTIAWKSEFDRFITKLPIVSERFCGISFQHGETAFLAYSLYLPTAGQDEEFLEILSLFTSDIRLHMRNSTALYVGTDTNQSEKSSKRRKEAMSIFTKEIGLKSILAHNNPTFHHNNQTSASQIDHILYCVPTGSQTSLSYLNQLCNQEDSDNLSAHDVIMGQLCMPKLCPSKVENVKINYYEEFLVKKPKWELENIQGYQEMLNAALLNLFETFEGEEFIPALTEMCSRALVLSAELSFETKNPKPSKRKLKTPKFSQELTEAYNQHQKHCKAWRAAGRPQSNTHPLKQSKLSSQRHLQRITRKEASEKAIKLHEELMECKSGDISKVCKKLKSIKGDFKTHTDITYIETLCGIYEGDNVLEGFCSNTELLCNKKESENTGQEFFSMCQADNEIIFALSKDDSLEIPHMTLSNLKDIIFKRLKLNKACDVYKLTVEHFRHAGDQNLNLILRLLNLIIDNLNHISTPQLNTAVATIVYKGKSKPVSNHKSYRQVRVSPLIGRLLDEYLRPAKIEMTRSVQNTNQYGFTENMSYLLGALQRHEVEKYCQDNKWTFFGCSLDGESAFEVVDREIQLRELYCSGQKGEFWQSSKYSYQNSFTQIKMNGQLSRKFEETLGVKQGNINSSDDYKIYINSALNTFEDASLGVWIGPINVSVSGVADDLYLMTFTQSKLQALIDIAQKYGHDYKISYGANKTKISVIGSAIDMEYYKDVAPWKIGDMNIDVVENNDHLGQIVSGVDQISKNIDQSLKKGRNSIFGLLGPAFGYKCLLGPLVKIHLFRTFTCPTLRSGLSSFALRRSHINPLSLFHRKILKGFLHLSQHAATPAIHFLFGELPIEAKIHRDMFSLFYSLWCNPDSKIHQVVKYILDNSAETSTTWAINLRHICKMYSLDDPSVWLKTNPQSKLAFKEMILSRITSFHEKELRQAAMVNSKMKYFNVSCQGLSGRHHPLLSNIVTAIEVKKLRLHIKFLIGDYLTFQTKFEHTKKGSPICKICQQENESISHIIATCKAYSVIRDKISTQFFEVCEGVPGFEMLLPLLKNTETFTQFILEPTSLNLPFRVNVDDKVVPQLLSLSRDLCFAVHKERMRLLNLL